MLETSLLHAVLGDLGCGVTIWRLEEPAGPNRLRRRCDEGAPQAAAEAARGRYRSCCSDHLLDREGVLEADVHLLPQPITPPALASAALHRGGGPRGTDAGARRRQRCREMASR